MPKLKWGSTLSEDDIENASTGGYTGKTPPAGVYRFKLRFAKNGVSSNGNPMLSALFILDGSWKPEHAKYDGAPLWDNITVMQSTAWKVKQFCDALGIKYKEFIKSTVVDDEGYVVKIGKLAIKDEDLLVKAHVKQGDYEDSPDGKRLEMGRQGLLPLSEDDEDDDEDGDDDDEDSDGGDDDDDDDKDPF